MTFYLYVQKRTAKAVSYVRNARKPTQNLTYKLSKVSTNGFQQYLVEKQKII
jgi:hypothetical protein